jgi:hypothetical protein
MSCESCHKELCKFAKKNLCRYGCYNCVNYVCYCKKVRLPDSSRIGVCEKSKSLLSTSSQKVEVNISPNTMVYRNVFVVGNEYSLNERDYHIEEIGTLISIESMKTSKSTVLLLTFSENVEYYLVIRGTAQICGQFFEAKYLSLFASSVQFDDLSELRSKTDTRKYSSRGSATPKAGGSATPKVGGSAIITPKVGGSATPKVGGSATPKVGGSATPKVGGSATPKVGGSAITPKADIAIKCSNSGCVEEKTSISDVDSTDYRECIICFENCFDKSAVITSCSHIYCKGCIDEWLENNNSCPYCRTEKITYAIHFSPKQLDDRKIGGSARADDSGSARAQPQVLLTNETVKDLNPLSHSGIFYYYLDRNQVKIELGIVDLDARQFEDGDRGPVVFTFKNLKTQFTEDRLRVFINQNSFS